MGNSLFNLLIWDVKSEFLILVGSSLDVDAIVFAGFSFKSDLVSPVTESASELVVSCLIAEVKVLSGLPDSPVGGILLVTPGWSLKKGKSLGTDCLTR